MARSSADLLLTPFGKYTLISRLSSGGMAELFLAVQHFSLGVQKLVVVKRILPSRRADQAFIDLFRSEAQIAATLSHPNVVHTLDAGEIDGQYFIVMEHVHGEDLRSILRACKELGGPMPLPQALRVMLDVCRGLAYVHEKRDLRGDRLGIVHGDMSTHNVVVSFTGDVKIVDFGIATTDQAAASGVDRNRIKGKPRYMSPEQAVGEALDARTDIFSLGVVLFELTTGRRLFSNGARADPEAGVVRTAAYARPTEAIANYPPALERIVLRALAPNRADRHPSARALQSDLEDFVHAEGIALSSLETSTWMYATFAEQIVRQQELLRSVYERVADTRAPEVPPVRLDVIPPPPPVPVIGDSLAPQAMSPPSAPPRRRVAVALVPLASAVALAAGFLYMRHDATMRLAAAQRAYRAALDARSPPPPPQPDPVGSLAIRTAPPGASVWVDDVQRPEQTPAEVRPVAVGRQVRITLTKEGFEPYHGVVTLAPSSPSQVVEVELQKRSGTVLVQFMPPVPVETWIDGRRWTGDHFKLDGLTTDQPHSIGFAAAGYETRAFRLSLLPGQTKTLNVSLRPADWPGPR